MWFTALNNCLGEMLSWSTFHLCLSYKKRKNWSGFLPAAHNWEIITNFGNITWKQMISTWAIHMTFHTEAFVFLSPNLIRLFLCCTRWTLPEVLCEGWLQCQISKHIATDKAAVFELLRARNPTSENTGLSLLRVALVVTLVTILSDQQVLCCVFTPPFYNNV